MVFSRQITGIFVFNAYFQQLDSLLYQSRHLWQIQPFHHQSICWQSLHGQKNDRMIPIDSQNQSQDQEVISKSWALAQALNQLSDKQLLELQQDVNKLANWLMPWFPNAPLLITLSQQILNADLLSSRPLSAQSTLSTEAKENGAVNSNHSAPLPEESPELKRFSQGIPGRKWQQMRYFSQQFNLMLSKADNVEATSDKESPKAQYLHVDKTTQVLEWCAGKGHLGRLIAFEQQLSSQESWNNPTSNKLPLDKPHKIPAQKQCYKITSLEWQQILCEKGQQQAEKYQLPQHFIHGDAFSVEAGQLLTEQTHAIALHACGDLHCQLIHHAGQQKAKSVLIAPCCYHLIRAEHYQPLSLQAQQSDIQLSKQDLKIPLQETVTGGQRIGNLRDIELQWRMAFDELQRELQQCNQYQPLPTLPKNLLTGEFKYFIHWAVENRQLNIAVDKLNLDFYLEKGQQRVQQIRRMELVQHLFRRPLELWLVLDRAMALEEAGFHVELTEFCQKNLTPRNILIKAYRP